MFLIFELFRKILCPMTSHEIFDISYQHPAFYGAVPHPELKMITKYSIDQEILHRSGIIKSTYAPIW
jgi:hypothetical protein